MSELENYLMDKEGEAAGTSVMPLGAPTYTDRDRSPTKTIRKTGEALTTNEEGVSGEQVKKLPQSTVRVDTTGKDAPAVGGEKKTAQIYALPSFGRYPLDSYSQVKAASAYFDEYRRRMEPAIRREFCQNLVKRASALGIPVSDEARKYGAEDYAPDGQVEAALDMRVGVIKEAAHQLAFEQLRESRHLLDPGSFAAAIGEFDKLAGIDGLYDSDVPDPYWTTFGEKKAEDGAILVGNDYISHDDLNRFGRVNASMLEDMFGQDFVDEFRKDPVAITKSLPVDQKKMVIRLAVSTLTDPTTT